MAKKRVEEENGQMELDNIVIDTTPQPMIVQSNPQVAPEQPKRRTFQKSEEPELINCLRNERVEIRLVKKQSGFVTDPNHVLSGGMADNATRSFVVPRLASTGMYKNVLTNNEKAFLENIMGLEHDALSIYRKHDNFWDDSNENGIGRVTLHKRGNFLNLAVPEDYIKYKILLANSDYIAPSLQVLEDRPKATYQFVIVSETAEAKNTYSKVDDTVQCHVEFGAIREDADKLRTIIELIEKRPTAPRVQLDYLQGKVMEYIKNDPRDTLRVLTDPLLNAKTLLKKAVEKGIVSLRNNQYYLKQDNSPLCDSGEESTLNNAAAFISAPRNSELKYFIEAKLKQE